MTRNAQKLLCHLSHLGIQVREISGKLELDGDLDELDPALAEEVRRREVDIVEHLRCSPGSAILGYPERFKIHALAFQESLVAEQRELGWIIAERKPDGEVVERWLHGPTQSRLAEIARELEELYGPNRNGNDAAH